MLLKACLVTATAGLVLLISACGGREDETPDVSDAAVIERAGDAPAEDTLLMPLARATTTELRAEDVATRVAALADDTFKGRAPGTETGEASADWIAAELARVGVAPGNDGSYFQTVDMVEQSLDTENSGLSFQVAGGADLDLELKTDTVIWTKRQTDDPLSFENSEIVFVGYGVVAPEFGWDDYAGLDVEGKTVVMLVNDPGFATEDPDLFNGRAMTYYGRWTYKYEEAARQGATAALVIHEKEPASYGWDVVAGSWSGAQADLKRANAGEDRVMLEGWITRDTAEALFAVAGLDFDELKETAMSRGFAPVTLDGVTATGRIAQSVTEAESRNVIGMVEGSARPDEFVLFVAHWDHLGEKDTFLEDDIFNGAVDNATGTAALLEIAEAIAADEPERSVVFLAVTLEESGLLGSAYFAEYPTLDLAQVVAGINMDALYPMPPSQNFEIRGYGASELEDRLVPILAAQGREITPDSKPEAGYFYRSDHISFAKKGVPMLYGRAGLELVEGGEPAGRAYAKAYNDIRYHKVEDEYADSWELSGMMQDIEALYELGLGLARSDDWPEWYDGNEFKSLREAMRAGRDG